VCIVSNLFKTPKYDFNGVAMDCTQDVVCTEYFALIFYYPITDLKSLFWQESERCVTKKEGIEFAREYGCLFLECSAKTKVNVEQCFEELVLKVCIGI